MCLHSTWEWPFHRDGVHNRRTHRYVAPHCWRRNFVNWSLCFAAMTVYSDFRPICDESNRCPLPRMWATHVDVSVAAINVRQTDYKPRSHRLESHSEHIRQRRLVRRKSFQCKLIDVVWSILCYLKNPFLFVFSFRTGSTFLFARQFSEMNKQVTVKELKEQRPREGSRV